jgi:hypothetical protein
MMTQQTPDSDIDQMMMRIADKHLPRRSTAFHVGDRVDVYNRHSGRFIMRGYVISERADGQIGVTAELQNYGYVTSADRFRFVAFGNHDEKGPFHPSQCRHATGEAPASTLAEHDHNALNSDRRLIG